MLHGRPKTATALAVALVVIMPPVVSCASTSDFEFLAAAREGDVNKVEAMLADGANVNSTDDEGNNAAFYAVSGENLPMLKVLVEHRINVNARNKDGDTILHIAARKESPGIVNLLIENEANLSAKDRNGTSALELLGNSPIPQFIKIAEVNGWKPEAAEVPEPNPEEVAEVPVQEPEEPTPPPPPPPLFPYTVILGSADTNFLKAVSAQDAGRVKAILGNGRQNQNETDSLGHSAIFYAIAKENLSVLDELLARGVNVNTPNRYGQLPLLYAISKNNLEIVARLLGAGAGVNAADRGLTPVMLATRQNSDALVRYLLDSGANVNARDGDGNTLLHVAVGNDSLTLVRLLKEKGADAYITNNRGVSAMALLEQSARKEFNEIAIDW